MPTAATRLLMDSSKPRDSHWLPFTANRYFRRHPKVIASAKGAYYTTADGRKLFDCLSGLWCTPLGHGHPKIVEAIRRQAETLDYSTAFQFTNPVTARLAERIVGMAPAGLDHVFFVNSGSESVDTALKIALGYHRVHGEASRTRMIGRERGYHGAGFGGISVGGITPNRKMFAAALLPGVDHLPHTYDRSRMAFTRGQPAWGAHLADDLERLVALHDASTIAAVIVEPVQGSTGVIVPPVRYLERLREICTRHGILLVFDEVITGFGRLGKAFAADAFGVVPDIITFAKALTNGVIPMGGVLVRDEIYRAFMEAPAPEQAIEFCHGYTYSGHPIAAAAAHAVLSIFEDEGMFERAATLAPLLADTVHELRGAPNIEDIRNIGLAAAIDLAPREGEPGKRGLRAFEKGIEAGLLLRVTGDTIALAPPFIATPDEIASMVARLHDVLRDGSL